jgi:hypothetical protein
MTEQTQQLVVEEIPDLKLSEIIVAQMTQLFQIQQNVNILQAELNRRLKLAAEKEKEEK